MSDIENLNVKHESNEAEQLEDAEGFVGKENDEISSLRSEIEILRSQLKEREELDRVNARVKGELEAFYEFFPDVDMDEIPDDVWERVKKGASLSAEYSLLLRKRELEKKKISDFNEKNRKMSAGSIGFGEGEKYYSPSEVKRMTPAQVRAHYDDIIESMRHWN